jgi:CheY-like chemotaxis protein
VLPFKKYLQAPLISDGDEKRNMHPDRKLKILLAEDNEVNQLFIVKILSRKDWTVDTAGTGIEVLEMMKVNQYDLILMDIQMPEMDGMEAAKRIREKERNEGGHVVIIALTANATEHDKISCLQSGMDDYLPKPIRTQKLYDCINRNILQVDN